LLNQKEGGDAVKAMSVRMPDGLTEAMRILTRAMDDYRKKGR
jgi:hypothetical protein